MKTGAMTAKRPSCLLAVVAILAAACSSSIENGAPVPDGGAVDGALQDGGAVDGAVPDGGAADGFTPVEVARVDQSVYAVKDGANQVVLSTPPYTTVVGQNYRLYGVLFVDTMAPYDTVAASYGMGNGNISCKTIGGSAFIKLIPFVENVLPGSTAYNQRKGFVFTGNGTAVTCEWRMAIHDPGTGLASASKHYRLAPGSYVQLTTAAPSAYDLNYKEFGSQNAAGGTRLTRLESTHIAHDTAATLTGDTVFVGDLQVNGCRGLEVVCLPTDWSQVVTVTAELKVYERNPGVTSGSTWCATQTVFSSSRTFKSDTNPTSPGQHHATVHGSGIWHPTPGCGTSVSVELRAINDTSAANCVAPDGCAVALYDSTSSRYVSVPLRW